MEFSRCARARRPPHERTPASRLSDADRRPVSQNSTANKTYEVDVDLGESTDRTKTRGHRDPGFIDGVNSHRSKSSGIPRKEVIQPQLPLRLPCYDFTPIINPTFDGCLPLRG